MLILDVSKQLVYWLNILC